MWPASPSTLNSIAWLVWRQTCFWSAAPQPLESEPFSAVTELIQGVWESHPRWARSILRSRIHTTAAPRPLELGMIRIMAKRWQLTPAEGRPEMASHRIEYRGLVAPSEPGWGAGPRWLQDRDVVACIRREGRSLFSQRNFNGGNRTHHAELLLMQTAWMSGYRWQPGDDLIVSLQPCKMCAGAWHVVTGGRGSPILFMSVDPGPGARQDFHPTRHVSDSAEREVISQLLWPESQPPQKKE